MAALSKGRASGGVGYREGVTACRMDCPSTTHLCIEEPACSRPERLPRGQIELVRDRRSGATVALTDRTTNGIVLSVEADPAGIPYSDGDRQSSDGGRVAQLDSLVVIPRLIGIDHRSDDGHTTVTCSWCIDG